MEVLHSKQRASGLPRGDPASSCERVSIQGESREQMGPSVNIWTDVQINGICLGGWWIPDLKIPVPLTIEGISDTKNIGQSNAFGRQSRGSAAG
jgi:hypothetical protein